MKLEIRMKDFRFEGLGSMYEFEQALRLLVKEYTPVEVERIKWKPDKLEDEE